TFFEASVLTTQSTSTAALMLGLARSTNQCRAIGSLRPKGVEGGGQSRPLERRRIGAVGRRKSRPLEDRPFPSVEGRSEDVWGGALRDRRIAARKTVLVAKSSPNPLRRMPLLDRRLVVRIQDRVDGPNQRPKLRPINWLGPDVARRRRIAAHLRHRVSADPQPPRDVSPAHSVQKHKLSDTPAPTFPPGAWRATSFALHPPPAAVNV